MVVEENDMTSPLTALFPISSSYNLLISDMRALGEPPAKLRIVFLSLSNGIRDLRVTGTVLFNE